MLMPLVKKTNFLLLHDTHAFHPLNQVIYQPKKDCRRSIVEKVTATVISSLSLYIEP